MCKGHICLKVLCLPLRSRCLKVLVRVHQVVKTLVCCKIHILKQIPVVQAPGISAYTGPTDDGKTLPNHVKECQK